MRPRFRWDENDGYCGETSALQMAALYYGAWISQYAARAAGGGDQLTGQLLLPFDPTDPNPDMPGRSMAFTAAALKLDVEWFPSKEAPQANELLQWTKQHLASAQPVILAVYIADCDSACAVDYDHIVPATGFCTYGSAIEPGYHGSDLLQTASLYSQSPAIRTFDSLPAGPVHPTTRDSCAHNTKNGGCLPMGTNYGVAIKGVKDKHSRTSLPVRLAINKDWEPDIAEGEDPIGLKGTVTVSGLTPGANYRLMRYNSIDAVPVEGDAAAFLASRI